MKAKTIRMIIIAMFIIDFAGFVAIDKIFNNPYMNLFYFMVTFCVICTAGAYISDYVVKHDMFKEVLGNKLYDILTNDDED